MKKVVLAGTFDTKAEEYRYFAAQLQNNGVQPVFMDLSTRGGSGDVDYPTGVVAQAAGTTAEAIRTCGDRVACMDAMVKGAANIINCMYKSGEVDGFAAMGGGQGTTMAMGIIRRLPPEMPKLLVSTILNLDGTAKAFEGAGSTLLMNSIVDIAGLNSILRTVIKKAAAAVGGMVNAPETEKKQEDKRLKRVAVTMWGVTTPCVDRLRALLESRNCEVFAFHANGIGGEAMEQYAESGFFDAIVDLTIPELTMTLAGSPAPEVKGRLLRAGNSGVKRVVSVGGADMVQFYGCDRIPPDKRERKMYCHNAEVCFVRSSAEENECFGREIAHRLEKSVGKVVVALPLKGVSALDVAGGQLYDPQADSALFETLKRELPQQIEVREYPCTINDEAFAKALFRITMELLEEDV